MSFYIKTISLSKLISLLVIFTTTFSLLIFISYSVHNSITTVSSDVMIGRFNLGGLKKEEIHNYLNTIAEEFHNDPQDAYIDPETKSLIPHLYGTKLNIEKTAQLIAKAKKGESIYPVIDFIESDKNINDYGNIPIYQGHPIKKQASLVINVSWGNEFNDYLQEMLDILEQEQVKCNFFLVGKWAEKYPEMVKKIHDGGHLFGNHGYSDPYMSKISDAEISDEIKKTNDIIHQITDNTPIHFSPPYGEKDSRIFERSFQDGMVNVLWSLDTVDWMRPGAQKMADRVLNSLHNGAIILMHNTEQTPDGLRLIISGIKAQGFEIVTVEELLSPEYYKKSLQKKIQIDEIEN